MPPTETATAANTPHQEANNDSVLLKSVVGQPLGRRLPGPMG